MKHDDSIKGHEDPLDAVLRAWKVDSALPPRFQEQVWLRIARAEADGKGVVWSGLLLGLERALARPALAGAYVAVLLAAGLSAGHWQVQREAAQLDRMLGLRYVQAVDPYQALRN